MKRFILLSFGFLGWAFYEMSGGGDFESASDREARLNPAPEVVVTEVTQPQTTADATTQEETPQVVDTDPPQQDVTRVALNLTTLQDAQEAETPQNTGQTVNIDPETGVAVNIDTLSSADTPAIIPSLIVGDQTQPQAQTEVVSNTVDVRRVSGNRVNVRGGPGTDFGVVARLVRGDEVEILQDNGNGWVRMRPVDGGTEGWMADFLLTSG